MIAGGSSKRIAITVTNKDDISLKYGIYYSSTDDLSLVDIGYYHSTDYLPNGIISSQKDYVVTILIDNKSDDIKTIHFGIAYGLENGGDLIIEDYQHFMEQKWNFPLREVDKGSYVRYRGNNGCVEGNCEGINANYLEGDNNGYCGDDKYNYSDSGWKVAYTKGDSAYLISAGSPSCIEQKDMNLDDFSKALNEEAINYCNIDYAYRGICNEKSVWAMNANDYYYMLGNKLNENSCYQYGKSKACGYENPLLDIGGYYWVNSIVGDNLLYYDVKSLYYTSLIDSSMKGVRPIIRMSEEVVVVKGSGTKNDPYEIKNTEVADYEYTVVYNGNGATSGDTLDSIHHTNVSQKLNKNMYSLTYQVKEDEFAKFDDSYCDELEVCHDSSVHVDYSKEQSATFLGWSMNPDDDKAMYLDEQEVVNLSYTSEEVVVNLYAIWKYDAFILPNIQERDGYKIMGWYTEKDGGEKVGDPGDKYTGIGNITLYARWEKLSL